MSKKTNGTFTLVPILVGSPNFSLETEIAQELLPYYQSPSVLFIVSTDFCHWGQRFDFTSCSKNIPIFKSIETLDRAAMDLIKNLDLEGFRKYLAATRNTICGRNPIQLLMNIVIQSKQVVELKWVDYAQSGQVTNPKDSSVSYAAAIAIVK
jgi:MEMO1 family protein